MPDGDRSWRFDPGIISTASHPAVGPDGTIYFATDGGTRWEDGPATGIYRIVPGGRR